MTISVEHFARMKAHVREETEDLVRESIARYLEHCSRTDIGAISLDGLFDTKQMMGVCASWVRNRLDVKWAAEMAANTPPLPSCTPCALCGTDPDYPRREIGNNVYQYADLPTKPAPEEIGQPEVDAPAWSAVMDAFVPCNIASGLHADDERCTYAKAHEGACSHGIPRDA
jgi:hypothetical protein